MLKQIVTIHIIVIVYPICRTRIIRRIYVDEVNFTLMCLFKQFKRSKIVSLNEKIHLSAIINEQVFIFSQYWRMGIKHLVNFLTVFLEYKSVFLAVYIFL